MLVAHTAAASTPLGVRFAVAIVAGLGAAAVMNVPIALLYYGGVPMRVAAGALFGRSVSAVPDSEAAAVHYAAGMATGALLEAVVLGTERALSATGRLLLGVVTLAEVVGILLVTVFVYAFFVGVVFPAYGGQFYENPADRSGTRRHWAVCAVVFGLGLLALVPTLYAVLPV
jgi:hypothetical protein